MEALGIIKPIYSDFPKYFEDLKDKAAVEGNVQVKQIMIRGLNSLRMSTGDDNKWWSWLTAYEESKKE